MKAAIQLFTLQDVNESLKQTLERVGETNYSGVEFAGLGDASPSEIASTLDEQDLEVVGAHVSANDLESEYTNVIETYGELDCPRIIVPSYETDAFMTAQGGDAAAERLSDLAERLDEDGYELLYHNHTFEFEDFGGETAMDRFVNQSSDLRLEIDTGLAKHAGADPVDLLQRYAHRVSLLHLTDTRSGSENTVHVELGNGEVDLEACLEAATDAGLDWTIYEHGRTTDPITSLAQRDTIVSTILRE